jgi:putative inorganic carbon (HCO3(-)) transporter
VRLGLWLSCMYLFAVYFRPQELYPELLQMPNSMDVLGGLAVAATLLDVVIGARPHLKQPQVWLLTFFVLWAAFSVAAASRWLGGAWIAFQELSVNGFVFLIVVLQGAQLSRVAAMRRTLIAALLVTVGFGLRAYYLGPRQAEFVLLERLQERQGEEVGAAASTVSDLTARFTGRGSQAAAAAAAAAASEERTGDGKEYGGSAWPTVPRLRALGLLNDPNDLAQTLVAALPLVFLAWRRHNPLRNLLFVLLPAAAMLWAVALTRSRGGLIALAALLWFTFTLRAGTRWARTLRWAGFAGLFLGLVLFFRLGAADASSMGRLEAWSEGLQMLKYAPIWGVGFGSFADVHGVVAHNSFVHCYAELGLVGYFAWLGAILACFWYLEQISVTEADSASGDSSELARWARALGLSLAAFLAGGLFLSRTYSVSLFLLVGFCTALAGVALETSEEPESYTFPIRGFLLRTGILVALSIALTYVVVVLGR